MAKFFSVASVITLSKRMKLSNCSRFLKNKQIAFFGFFFQLHCSFPTVTWLCFHILVRHSCEFYLENSGFRISGFCVLDLSKFVAIIETSIKFWLFFIMIFQELSKSKLNAFLRPNGFGFNLVSCDDVQAFCKAANCVL